MLTLLPPTRPPGKVWWTVPSYAALWLGSGVVTTEAVVSGPHGALRFLSWGLLPVVVRSLHAGPSIGCLSGIVPVREVGFVCRLLILDETDPLSPTSPWCSRLSS